MDTCVETLSAPEQYSHSWGRLTTKMATGEQVQLFWYERSDMGLQGKVSWCQDVVICHCHQPCRGRGMKLFGVGSADGFVGSASTPERTTAASPAARDQQSVTNVLE